MGFTLIVPRVSCRIRIGLARARIWKLGGTCPLPTEKCHWLSTTSQYSQPNLTFNLHFKLECNPRTDALHTRTQNETPGRWRRMGVTLIEARVSRRCCSGLARVHSFNIHFRDRSASTSSILTTSFLSVHDIDANTIAIHFLSPSLLLSFRLTHFPH